MSINPPEKFERIYEENARDILTYLLRSVREEATARDLLQDTFLNFFRIYKEKTLPDDTGCRMYLFRVARNLMINHSKSRYRQRVNLVPEYTDSQEPTDGERPETQFFRKENVQQAEELIQRMLDQLDERSRTAVLMRFQQDMRLEDIAQVLNTSVSTVSRTIQKAQKQLTELSKKAEFKISSLED
ncbi:MAG: sigma-70 family RNA polymerase sigma factor [Leptospiraceae bacterium]|nr:sigma-70 family RNA polymerase sigma factor [Leptospiraceae bacterium]